MDSIRVSQHEQVDPQELAVEALPTHLIVIHTTPNPVQVREIADDLRLMETAHCGDINILPAGIDSSCRWEQPLSFVSVEMPTSVLNSIGEQIEHPQWNLVPSFHQRDLQIVQIGQWLAQEHSLQHPNGKLYQDSLVNLLGVHLLRGYSGRSPSPSQSEWPSQQQVRQALDYMHAHLEQDISLEALSQAVHVSPTHLRRLFKRSLGKPPHQVLIELRVKRAQELLSRRTLSIREVATLVGFSDQSHLNRHFKRLLGVTPGLMQ